MISSQRMFENIFSLIIMLLILGLVFPYGVPIYTPLVLVLFFITFVIGGTNQYINFGIFLLFLNIILYVWGLFLNKGILYSNNITDLINIGSLLLLLFTLSYVTNEIYIKIKHKIHLLISVTTILVSLFSLYKFYALLNNVKFDFLYYENKYPAGSSLMVDYNMFSLGMIMGIISITYLILNVENILISYLLFIAYVPLSVAVFFSSSRRGMLILTILLFLIMVLLIKKSPLLRNTKRKVLFLLLILLIITFTIRLTKIVELDINNHFVIEDVLSRSLGVYDFSNSISSRTNLWDQSLEILSNSSILQIVFGNGFNYLDELGRIFKAGGEEYPHNFLLSTFMYSGIIGLVVLLALIIYVIYRSIIGWKEIGLDIVIMFIISLIFMSVSGNSLFSSKLLTVLIVIILSVPFKKRASIEKY